MYLKNLNVRSQEGVSIKHTARQVRNEDFARYDYILGADNDNVAELKSRQPPGLTAEMRHFGSFDDKRDKPEVIKDPFLGGRWIHHALFL